MGDWFMAWATRLTSQAWETIWALAQGGGALVLAWFTYDTAGGAGARLAYPYLWSLLLAIGGVAALCLSAAAGLRNEWTWTSVGACLSTAMMGRGLDILWRVDEFSGRPSLAVAIWLTMAVATATAWAALGAMADALEVLEHEEDG